MSDKDKTSNHLHDGHRERLRERFIEHGLDGFNHHQILELLLYYSIPRRDTNEIAHRLIDEFGSFSGVFDANYNDLCKVDGIGGNSASLIKLIPAICRAYMDDKQDEGTVLNTTEKAGKYLINKFIGHTEEVIYMICMDNKCRVLKTEMIGKGTMNAVGLSIRKMAEIAMRCSATCVILAHNHPHGTPLPSRGDVRTTISIVSALGALNIRVNDHIIVAGNEFVSMADSQEHKDIFLLGQ